MKNIDYELIQDLSLLFQRKIVVYGIGEYGRKIAKVLSDMHIEISFFVQTVPEQDCFLDTEVIALEEFFKREDCEKYLTILASHKYYEEMIRCLEARENIFVCTCYAVFVSLFLNYKNISSNAVFKDKIKFLINESKKFRINLCINPNHYSKWYVDILENPKKILLYQPGKVGSATIWGSELRNMFHVHSLAAIYGLTNIDKAVYKEVLSIARKQTVKVITGVREPVARDISAFFQGSEYQMYPFFKIETGMFELYGDYYKKPEQKLTYDVAEKRLYMWENSLQASYDKMCQVIVENRTDEFSWFDYEIKALFDVDIFEYPFDKERGYTVIEKDNIQIFVYKCEKLSGLEKEIGEFIGDSDFRLSNSNVGAKKVYSYTYKAFKEDVQIDRAYFDYYYENPKWLSHFYTEAEIAGFRKKWESKLKD